MALFAGNDETTLADVLGKQAATKTQGINENYAKQKRRSTAIAGATGRLNSGVQNYTTGDIGASQLGELGGVQSGLANALAGIQSEDYLGTEDFNRSAALARLIAEMNKPSDLETAFGAIGAAGRVGGTIAAFA